MADALATLASMFRGNKQEDMKSIQMGICDVPAHCYSIDEEEEERDDHPWYQDILRYVKNRVYPDQATENDKRTLRRLAGDYVLYGEILYKIRKDQVLLRCVNAVEVKKILKEIHEGVCGTHANGFTMGREEEAYLAYPVVRRQRWRRRSVDDPRARHLKAEANP
ncbi:uncharacterized protein [Gossypium hirsutum]|uniref:Uncharacterized protein n=1 Tax=Gossypium hirsutum TaxID=3635 RepID=A0ABM3A5H6_GOSHI|nr:uncharacterized protein LOC121217817 [Gossypium hirsutum]